MKEHSSEHSCGSYSELYSFDIEDFPSELWIHIISYLDFHDKVINDPEEVVPKSNVLFYS